MSDNDHRKQYGQEEIFVPFMTHQEDSSYYRQAMRTLLPSSIKGMKVLDIGCGTGHDLDYFVKQEAEAYGVDVAKTMVEHAKAKVPNASVIEHDFTSKLPFEDQFFDMVYSQFAIEHEFDLSNIFKEVHRVLKVGGIFITLVVHPMKHFLEKKGENYFQQEQYVESFFDGTTSIHMISHRFEEYLSEYMLTNFHLTGFLEKSFDPDNAIKEKCYPSYMILRFNKL